MPSNTTGRVLLVLVAIVGLALAVPAVSADGNETTTTTPAADEAPPYNGTADADEWATWMEGHMVSHMGPGSVEWMEGHMGVTVEEMAGYMAENGTMYGDGSTMNGQGMYGSGQSGYGGCH